MRRLPRAREREATVASAARSSGWCPPAARGHGRWRPGGWRLLAAASAGGLLAAGMPPRTAWYLAPLAVALLTWSLLGQGAQPRVTLGAVGGLAFFGPTLSWLTGFHPAGFAAVLVLEVLLFAAAMLLVDPRSGRWWTVPGALIALEAARARFPFGGFPLPGIALGQLDGPFAAAAPLGGALLVVGLATGAGAAVAGLAVARRRGPALVLVAALAAVGAAGAVPAAPDGGGAAGQLRVALAQGGGPRGIPAVRADEQAVTERLVEVSAALPADRDLVLWPESAVVVRGPVAGTPAADRMSTLAGAPGPPSSRA